MKIWCTVMRKNGTYKTVPIKAGKSSFILDKNVYLVTRYYIGRIGAITVLRAIYFEGCPMPIEIDIDEALKKAKLRIDSKAIKSITNKKILDVFGEAEFTRLEMLMAMLTVGAIGIGVVNLVFLLGIANRIGM